jgi:Ser-tRNA(Ala) deacylase AlaX
MDNLEPTALRFHAEMDVLEGQTQVQACIVYSDLLEADQQLYKGAPAELCAIVVKETLFHPQGGGQPSDVGEMVIDGNVFDVLSARTAASRAGVVLHFGTFRNGRPSSMPTGNCTQSVNAEKRLLYSKYHTAGHVLGSAIRHLLEKEVPGFDELKASHFPDSASCEFAGLIAGTHKEAVQQKLDEFIAAAMPVEIEFWSEADFHREGVARLLPDEATREAMGVKPGEKFRVVKIVGAEVYPCGGTHVHTTDQCGKTVVKKISRSKGTSRVSYTLPDA